MGKTLYQIIMQSPPTGKPKAKAKPPTPPNPTREPIKHTPVDGMKLSAEDYDARLRQLGLQPPNVAPVVQRPMGANDIEAHRARDESRRAVERAGRRLDRERTSQQNDREAELQPGSFDARTATPEQVRARYAQLGLDSSTTNLHVSEVGRPLPSRTSADAHASGAKRANDMIVARHVEQAVSAASRSTPRSSPPASSPRLWRSAVPAGGPRDADRVVAQRSPQLAVVAEQRPQTRGDCASGPRPCPWISCRHHVVDVVINFHGATEALGVELAAVASPAEEDAWMEAVADRVASLGESCVLDLVERDPDGATLEDVGDVFGRTRERIRQIEKRGLEKLGMGRRQRSLREHR